MYSGVGCGIMFEGKIYRGAKGYAGEVSIHNYKESNSFNCNIGDPCFLKRWEKDLGMIKDLKEKLSNNKEYAKPILDLVENKIENINLKTIFTAIRFNNPLVKEILDEVANRLGIKIAFLVNFLNPEAVIIGGGLEDAGDDFLKRIIQTVKDWAFREAVEDLKIIYSRLKENASAYGAAALMMERFFTQA
jgi:glucokinase